MKRFVFLVVVVLSSMAYAGDRTPESLASVQRIADDIVDHLVKGQVDSVACFLHYPASYSDTERAEDIADVRESLTFLLSRLGDIRDFKLFTEQALYYEMVVSGGDPSYWEAIQPLDTVYILYKGQFSEVGSGYLVVSCFESKSGVQIRGLVFGVDVSVEGARDIVVAISRDLVHHMAEFREIDLPEHIDELIEASVPHLKQE